MQIHTISMGLSQAYLIEHDCGLMIVDAGLPGSESKVIDLLHKLKRDDLKLIFISHAHLDHYGSAAALRRLTGAKIAIHHADENAMAHGKTILGSVHGRGRLVKSILPLMETYFKPEPTPADILLEDGDILGIDGLEGNVLHTPGHTPGSSCLVIQGGFAFVGDLISSNGKPHVQPYFAQDWSNIPISVKKLQAVKPNWVYPGHGNHPIDEESLQRL